jgi:hypothetical protein
LFQYRLQDIDTAKLGVTRLPRGNRTLADAVARRPAPKAEALTEFAVMRGIADLLERLNDEPARTRVLQWVHSVYRQRQPVPAAEPAPTTAPASALASTAIAPAPIPTPTPALEAAAAPATPAPAPPSVDALAPETIWEGEAKVLSDSDLSVDDLEDWFVQPRETPFPNEQPPRALFANEPPTPAPIATAQPAQAPIATAQSAPTPGGTTQSDQTPAANVAPAHSPAEGDASQPVVSMIHDFVADFQKLARDWQES